MGKKGLREAREESVGNRVPNVRDPGEMRQIVSLRNILQQKSTGGRSGNQSKAGTCSSLRQFIL